MKREDATTAAREASDATAAAREAASAARDATVAAGHKVRDLGAFIREQRKAAEMSLRHLANVAGVSNPYLSQIERGLRKPSADILRRVAEALRISAETLYVKAGILEEREDDLIERMQADPYITEEQKRHLVAIYRSFRAQRGAPVDAEQHEP